VEREALLQEIRHQLRETARIHHGTRELVAADLGRLLDHEHGRHLEVLRLAQVREPDHARQRRDARAHEQNVHVQPLALYCLAHAREHTGSGLGQQYREPTRNSPARPQRDPANRKGAPEPAVTNTQPQHSAPSVRPVCTIAWLCDMVSPASCAPQTWRTSS
jgi:ParB-like chromosome segregation protein Spo0J